METDDAKRGQVQRLAATVNAYRRQRLNAYPKPPDGRIGKLGWVLVGALVIGSERASASWHPVEVQKRSPP